MSTNDQLQQAYQLIKAGNRQDAVQILMPILKADQSNADAWWLLANAVTDPSQQRRALNEVLKLRPGDEKALRMLGQLPSTDPPATTPAPVVSTPPPASTDPFADPGDPFADAGDPYTPAPKQKNDAPPVYAPPVMTTPTPVGNVPPAPIYVGPAPRRGPSCCLLFGCLAVVLFCIAPLLCVGAGFAGLSPVFNDVARTLGARDFQGLADVFSGQATPLPGSALDDAFSQMGVSNMGELQGTMQGSIDQLATMAGTPGIVETAAASFGMPIVGQPMPGSPVSRGNIEPGQTVNGNISSGSAGDAWVLSASAGATYVIDAEGDTSVDTILSVVDSSNTVVAFNDDGGSGTDSRLEFTPDTSGKYTIVVGTFGNIGGSYTLVVEQQ